MNNGVKNVYCLIASAYNEFSNHPSGGVRVHFIVGSNGPGYMVVQETKWYISTLSGEWLQRLCSYIQYRGRRQEDGSTTCLYPCLRSGDRHSGADGSGVDSDSWS